MNYFSIAIWTIICLFLPGAVLLYGPLYRYSDRSKKYISTLFILPLSFSLSVALISVLGWIGYFLRLNFQFVERSLLAIILLLVLIVFFIRKSDFKATYKSLKIRLDKTNFVFPNPNHELRNRFPKSTTWQVGIWVLAISAGLLSAWAGPWLSNTADAFGHISATRSVIIYNNPLPQEIFFPANVTAMSPTFGTWNLALGIVTNLSQADVVLVWKFVNVLLAPLMVLAFSSMAYAISRRLDATFLSAFFYFLLFMKLDFRALAYPNKMGQILLWLTIVFVIHYAQLIIPKKSTHISDIGFRKNKSELLLVALLAFGSSTIHLQYGSTLMLVLGIALVIAFITQYGNFISKWAQKLFIKQPDIQQIVNRPEEIPDRNKHQVINGRISVGIYFRSLLDWRFLHSSSIAIIAALVPFAYKTMQMLSSPSVKLIEESSGSIDTIDFGHWFNSYQNTLILVVILLISSILLWKKDSYGSAVIIAGVLTIPLFIVLSNTFIGTGGTLNTVVARLFNLVPAILYVGFGWLVVESIELLRTHHILKQFSFRLLFLSITLLASISYVVVLLDGPLYLYSPTSTQENRIAVSREGNLTHVWADAITAIKALPEKSILFSDLSTSYMLNGLTGIRVVSLVQQHTSLWDKDINNLGIFNVMDFTAGKLDAEAEIKALLDNKVTHVFLSKNQTPDLWNHVQTISPLELIAEGVDWRLYWFNPKGIDDYLAFIKEKEAAKSPVEIINLYRSAENLFSNKEQYAEAAAIETNIPQELVLDFLAKGNAYQSPLMPGSTYNFVAHLNDAVFASIDDQTNIRQTVFIIDSTPFGVLFQHPPSQVSFDVNIPARAWIQFSPVSAPEVWQFGKGDGVQFNIELETQDKTRYVLYAEYLDPKNILSQRKLITKAVSLAHWSGQTVKIIFATGCGPNNDCRYDWAGWGEPRILQPVAYNFLDHFTEAFTDTLGTETGQAKIITEAINFEERPFLYQHPSSRVVYSIDLPPKASIQFGLGMSPEAWEKSDGVEYNLYVRSYSDPDALFRVFQRIIDPKSNPDDRQWLDERVDLSQFGGQKVEIIFEALPGPAGNFDFDWGGWSSPMLIDETPPGSVGVISPDVLQTSP